MNDMVDIDVDGELAKIERGSALTLLPDGRTIVARWGETMPETLLSYEVVKAEPSLPPWPPRPIWAGKLRLRKYYGDCEIDAAIVEGPDGPVLLKREGMFCVEEIAADAIDTASLLAAMAAMLKKA